MFAKGRQLVILTAHQSNVNKITPSNDTGVDVTWLREKENWFTTEGLSVQLSLLGFGLSDHFYDSTQLKMFSVEP